MAQSLEEFLTQIHLEQYISNFIVNQVNILNANDEILQSIGIHMIGHRKRILNEIIGLRTQIDSDNFNSGLSNRPLKNTEEDEPPPLPPKSLNQSRARVLNPELNIDEMPKPEKEHESNIQQKPIKPPRRSLRTAMSLPVGTAGTTDYKMLSFSKKSPPPVIPPRADLGEEQNAVDQTIKNDLNENVLSPTRSAPPIPSNQPTKSSPVESNLKSPVGEKPIPPVRPPRLSVKRLAPKPPKTIPESPPIVENDVSTGDLKDSSNIQDEKKEKSLLDVPSEPHSAVSDDEEDEFLFAVEDDDVESGDEKIKDTFTLSMFKDKERFMSIVDKTGTRKEKLSIEAKKDNRKSRYLQPGKSGYLSKRGGQKGDKSVKKRWIEFNGNELSYHREKNNYPIQIIPVSRMTDVEIEPSAKKPTFHLITPNRRFTFQEPDGNQSELTIWVSILMEAILNKDPNVACEIGGRMAEPNKEGWLSKQGHNLMQDFKDRYVAIKDDKLCYYNDYKDFKDDLPINCLEMALVSLKEDVDKQRLCLHTNREKTFVFEAKDAKSHSSWKAAIERSIQIGLGSAQFLQEVQLNVANQKCADCGEKDPIYASVNLLVVLCPDCIGCHRSLGVSISKSKSLLMDVKIWKPSLVKLFQTIGNENANSLWCSKLPSDDKIKPDEERERRHEFISGKYKDKRYFQWSELFGCPDELGQALRENVVTENVLETLKLIISGADVYYVPEESEDQRTPYELARDAGMELQMELLVQYNGHLTSEEREELQSSENGFINISAEELANELDALPKLTETPMNVEKSGVLMIRSTKNESWKEKLFSIQGRQLKFVRGLKPEETEMLDLTQLEELEYGKEDSLTITMKIAGRFKARKFHVCNLWNSRWVLPVVECILIIINRIYYLKGHTQEDSDSWFSTIRYKQVMGVPIECQECNDKGIPYLIEKCVGFVERNGLLTIGIYRLSGSMVKLKKLIVRFNQDPVNVRLTVDEFPDIHEVSGLLKQYLRELPEPLLTTQLYEKFIANSYETEDPEEHSNKLYAYKDLLSYLPTINYQSLRCLVLHLIQVIKLHDRNKMALENIIMLFGPILLSNANTTEQSWLNSEYTVLKDLLDFYEWLFDVAESETKAADAMIDVLLKQETIETQPQQPAIIDTMQIPVIIQHSEDQMKMTNRTTPSDVCMFAIQKSNLSVDGNWGLFEVTKDKVYERPVHAKEPVLQLAINVGGGSDLVVKFNYVAERIAAYQTSITASGLLHYAKDEGKWNKNYFVEIKTGDIKIYKKKGDVREHENIPIHEIVLYLGMDLKRKAPDKSRHGFMIKNTETALCRYFCLDNENEINKFVAAILNIRYPTGLWTQLNSNENNEECEKGTSQDVDVKNQAPIDVKEAHWGRQSTYVRSSGTSARLKEQLQHTRFSLKKHVLRK